MLIGYARVSTAEKGVALQVNALQRAGCERILRNIASGATSECPGLNKALTYLRKGDALVVWRLERLGRYLKHLIETVARSERRGIGFRSLQESIDTITSGGRLVFHILAAPAEFEQKIVRERTRGDLAAARARGRTGGRRKALDEKKVKAELHPVIRKKPTVRSVD